MAQHHADVAVPRGSAVVGSDGQRYRLRGAEVTVCKAFDGSVTVPRDGRELPVRLLAAGEETAPVEVEKTVVRRVDRAKAEQRSRPTYKPRPDHPWCCLSHRSTRRSPVYS